MSIWGSQQFDGSGAGETDKVYVCDVSPDVLEQGKTSVVRKEYTVPKNGTYDIAYNATCGSTDINSRAVTVILSCRPNGEVDFEEKNRAIETISE